MKPAGGDAHAPLLAKHVIRSPSSCTTFVYFAYFVVKMLHRTPSVFIVLSLPLFPCLPWSSAAGITPSFRGLRISARVPPMSETQYITRQGTNEKIAYQVSGSGEPLLFLHGLGADKSQTTSALTDLPNIQLIAPDMLGHGESLLTDQNSTLNFDSFADDAIAILDQLGIEKANIGGLSMGSGISLNIALRYPDRINKLILLRPSWLNEKKPAYLSLVAVAGKLIEQHGLEKGEAMLAENADYQTLLTENEKVALSINGVFKRPQALTAASVLYRMWEDSPFPNIESLTKIPHPIITLWTTRDELHPFNTAEKIANALPNNQSLTELPPRYYDPSTYTVALRESVIGFL